MYWTTGSGRIELNITKKQAAICAHSGDCEPDVKDAAKLKAIRKQLDAIPANVLADELKEYGAWDDEELQDHEQNKIRLLWIATGDIIDGNY